MPKVHSINAVFVYVEDMLAMRGFYENVLGLGEPVVATDLWVEFDLPGCHLALHQGDPRIIEKQDAMKNTVKFSLLVEDVDALCAQLKEKGVRIVFGPRKDFGSLLAEVQDVEGNPIRLVQKVSN